MAILALRRLREEGFPENKIGLLVCQKGKYNHMVTIAFADDSFYILDCTGYYTWEVQPREFLAEDGITPIVGFNLFSIWEY